MKFEIRSRWTDSVLFGLECGSLRLCVEAAVKAKANLCSADLRGADLRGANLRGADLRGANLRGADLRGADLRGANLCSANLCGANLRGANLCGADLRGANLCSADLRGANLCSADLRGANLCSADLCGANLRGANLCGADLCSADLRGANLRGAKNAQLAIAQTRILPEGDIIGWKRCNDGVIVKLKVPADARRSHAFGRKCRAEYADVIEVIGGAIGVTDMHGPRTEYRAGERVKPDGFCDDWMIECAQGVHFFITRAEAEAYV